VILRAVLWAPSMLGYSGIQVLTGNVIIPVRKGREGPWGSVRQLTIVKNIRNMMRGTYLSVWNDLASSQEGVGLFHFGSLIRSLPRSWLAKVGEMVVSSTQIQDGMFPMSHCLCFSHISLHGEALPRARKRGHTRVLDTFSIRQKLEKGLSWFQTFS
jgi:hypothetical protein